MHADERDPVGGGRGRQYLEEFLVAVTGERGDDHGVEAGIGGLTGAHVGVGVDPEDRQIIAVLVDQVRERRHAYRALAANRGDAGRFVFGDDRQRAAQLLNHNGLRLDAVPLLEPNIAHLEARQRSGQRAQAAPLGAPSCQPNSRAERHRRETQEPASERSRYQRPATAATPNAGVGQR